MGCVPQAMNDISQNYILDIIEKDKVVYDQFDWLPDTEKCETGFLRYDLIQAILLSPFSYLDKTIMDNIWNYILQPYECDSVVRVFGF